MVRVVVIFVVEVVRIVDNPVGRSSVFRLDRFRTLGRLAGALVLVGRHSTPGAWIQAAELFSG
ncbi:MAG: hypothetical protein K2X35_00970 [Bryobacteraceae bacterium]|nr:hypothetical protein [Bryobacteraceae bacterium]